MSRQFRSGPVCGVSDLSATSDTSNARSGANCSSGPELNEKKLCKRAFCPSPKSAKLMFVVSPEELPNTTTTPFASTACNAVASDAPPADSRMSPKRPCACSMPTTTSVAPNSRSPAARSGRPATAVTCAPERAASCTARWPTPPAAPVISTRLPSNGAPCRNVRNAVRPATGSAAAAAKLTVSGSAAMRCVGTAARSAQPNSSINATIRAPAGGPLPSAACRNTMALMSWPGIQPSSLLRNDRNSPRLSESACTATSASRGPGAGSGTCRSSTGALPLGVLTSASICLSPVSLKEQSDQYSEPRCRAISTSPSGGNRRILFNELALLQLCPELRRDLDLHAAVVSDDLLLAGGADNQGRGDIGRR